jgi:hypothetical protein
MLAAGARSVVATRWRVGDRATVAFARDFYAALARGLPVADALREARLPLLRRGAPPTSWAAFTVVGDPLVTVPLRQPAPTLPPWWTLAALTAAPAGLLAYRAYRGRARSDE